MVGRAMQEIISFIIPLICFSMAYISLVSLFSTKVKITIDRLLKYLALGIILNCILVILIGREAKAIYIVVNAMIICCLFYREKLISKVWMLLVANGIEYGCEIANTIFLDWIIGHVDLGWFARRMLLPFSTMLVVIAVVSIINSLGICKKEKKDYDRISKQQVITIIVLACTCYFLVYMAQIIYDNREYIIVGNPLIIMIVYIAICGNIYLVLGVNENISKKHYLQINGLMQDQFEKQLAYYERLEVVSRETRAIKHDMYNHMLVMQSMLMGGEYNNLERYIQDICCSINRGAKFIKTGNMIVDAIINEKYAVASEKNVKMNINVHVPEDIGIDLVDLCVIFANGIDNAIEECSKILDREKRIIELSAEVKSGYLFFCLNNTMQNEQLKIINNRVRTSKIDKENHGYGLENIYKSVSKYGGDFEIKAIDYRFNMRICINTSENNKSMCN